MIILHDAIYALNPSIVTIRGDIAYDKNGVIVEYDLDAAEAKLAEMQAAEETAQQAAESAKQTAMAKLAKLGLTEDEVAALMGAK